jgi:hypothetical protein
MLPTQLHSTLTVKPPIPLQVANSYTPQNPVRTSLHNKMKNPAIQQNPTPGQIHTGGQSSSNMKNMTSGQPPLTSHTPIAI